MASQPKIHWFTLKLHEQRLFIQNYYLISDYLNEIQGTRRFSTIYTKGQNIPKTSKSVASKKAKKK